jgi:hypothetical protein
MVNDTARLLKITAKKGKNAVGYQGLRLATIVSVEPFKMKIDKSGNEYLASDVLINAQIMQFSYTADISGQASIQGQNSSNGTLSANGAAVTTRGILAQGDRVAVASVGMNKVIIICKAVNLQ